jgi:hypothetical protein
VGVEHDVQAGQDRSPPVVAPGATPALDTAARVLALQRGAGNQAVTRMLARATGGARLSRWDTPLQGGVPAGAHATDFAVFIKLIQDEEAKLPAAEQVDTKLMITRLRKLFYGNKGWDDVLIPGAKGDKPLYDVQEVETGRREFEGPGPNVIDFVDKKQTLVGAPAAISDPSSIQEVKMPNGDFVDVGHVFAGLDALNHPSKVNPFYMYEMSSNVDAVTWAGDLGSVLAEVIFQAAKLGRPLTGPEVQAQIDEMAPVQDMLGNVDAYVIGNAFAVSSGAGKKVSDILLEYYGAPGTASAAGEAARSQRFTTFAAQLGLGPLTGGAFTGEAAWLTKYELEVGKAGALYVGATSEIAKWSLTWGLGGKLGLMDAVRDNPFRRRLLEKFLAALKAKVAAEAAVAAPAGGGGP